MICRAKPLDPEAIRFSLCEVMTYQLAGRAITAQELQIYTMAARRHRGGRIFVDGKAFDLSDLTPLFRDVERRLVRLAVQKKITFRGVRFEGGQHTSGSDVAVPVEFLLSGVWLEPMANRIHPDLDDEANFGTPKKAHCKYEYVYLSAEDARRIKREVDRPQSGVPEQAIRAWLAERQGRNDWGSGPADHAACQAELGRTFARDHFLNLRREYAQRPRGRPRKMTKT